MSPLNSTFPSLQSKDSLSLTHSCDCDWDRCVIVFVVVKAVIHPHCPSQLKSSYAPPPSPAGTAVPPGEGEAVARETQVGVSTL